MPLFHPTFGSSSIRYDVNFRYLVSEDHLYNDLDGTRDNNVTRDNSVTRDNIVVSRDNAGLKQTSLSFLSDVSRILIF